MQRLLTKTVVGVEIAAVAVVTAMNDLSAVTALPKIFIMAFRWAWGVVLPQCHYPISLGASKRVRRLVGLDLIAAPDQNKECKQRVRL
jgi:ribulose 1,5-bisphosphate carboxylase large subunit-like protein